MGIDFGELTGFIVIASGAAVLGMSYFAAYFDQLWAALQSLDTYLGEIDGNRYDKPE